MYIERAFLTSVGVQDAGPGRPGDRGGPVFSEQQEVFPLRLGIQAIETGPAKMDVHGLQHRARSRRERGA